MKLTLKRADVEALLAHIGWMGNPTDVATDMLPELCQAWLALDAAARWRPIETAPKDGTKILVFDEDFGPDVANWQVGCWFETEGAWCGNDGDYPIRGATHWLPLPAPPEGAKDGIA